MTLFLVFLILSSVLFSEGLIKYFIAVRRSTQIATARWYMITGLILPNLFNSLWWIFIQIRLPLLQYFPQQQCHDVSGDGYCFYIFDEKQFPIIQKIMTPLRILLLIFLIVGIFMLVSSSVKWLIAIRRKYPTISAKWSFFWGVLFVVSAINLWWFLSRIEPIWHLPYGDPTSAPPSFSIPESNPPPQARIPTPQADVSTSTPPAPRQQVIIEDAGKENVENLPEVEALRQKYGEQRLFIKALDRHLIGHEAEWHTDHAAMMEHDELLYSVRQDWDPKITGCVIVVYAAGEGYVYQEDKALKVIGKETLAEFFKKTEKVSPEIMYRFYLSLH